MRAPVPSTSLLALAVLAGCFGGRPDTTGRPGQERAAALARLVVDNRTGRSLAIAFRYLVEPGGEVGVGTAPAGRVTEMAPVPAAEPIVLLARAPGFELRRDPISLEIDELWTWVITRDSMPDGP